MGRVIFVTGFKGGVGKTTVAANVASSLHALGKRVLVIDGDFGMRCMDMVLGTESDTLFDCSDILLGRCSYGAAVTEVKGNPDFLFIPAPMNFGNEKLPESSFDSLFCELRDEFDFIIIDSGADLTPWYMSFARHSDEALIVTLHQSASVRAAEKTASRLAAMGLEEMSLVVNGYRESFALDGSLPSIRDIISRSSVKLIGVVPYGETLQANQEAAELAFAGDMRKKAFDYEAAFFNIASRICSRRVSLFENVANPKKRCSYEGVRTKSKNKTGVRK